MGDNTLGVHDKITLGNFNSGNIFQNINYYLIK